MNINIIKMSKRADKDSSEFMSSRDIILSRYQTVKNLLVTKNKLPNLTIAPKPAEKLKSPKFHSSRERISEEDDNKLNNLITLCSQIQGKIKEKTVQKTTIVYEADYKQAVDISVFHRNKISFQTLMKPCSSLSICTEKTTVRHHKLLLKPKTSGYFCELTSKTFQIVNRVYQIIEFKEEKKIPIMVEKNPSQIIPNKPHTFSNIIEEPQQIRGPRLQQSTSNIQVGPKLSASLINKSKDKQQSAASTDSVIPQVHSKSPLPIRNPESLYHSREAAALNQSVLIPSSTSLNAFEPPLSYDDFMKNETLGKSNYSSAASQKLTKQAQLLQFKQKAKEKEILMQKRKSSVMKIQAMYRGWKQRKVFSPVWERHKRKQTLAKLRKIAGRIKSLFAPYIILRALRSWVVYRKKEKLKLLALFENYAAVSIQKLWRGHSVRQHYSFLLKARSFARSLLRGLVRGWKMRKVLSCRDIANLKTGIQDLASLREELRDSSTSQSLYMQVSNQIPIMKGKFIKEVYRLFRTGAWVNSTRGFSNQNSVHEFFANPRLEISNISAIYSREDVPVKALQVDFGTEEALEVMEVEKPKTVFKNFLRRGQNSKYNPKDAEGKNKAGNVEEEISSSARGPCEFEESMERVPIPVQKVGKGLRKPQAPERERESEESEENDEVLSDLESKEPAKPIHNFLKRKSQTYKPAKLEWKAKPRINCWGESLAPEPKKKAVKKIQTSQVVQKSQVIQGNQIHYKEQIRHITFSRVKELEAIFSQLIKKHVTVNEHFAVATRTQIDSDIPQFLPHSCFITHFTDDMYQETFEALQTHYLYLCNEEDMQ